MTVDSRFRINRRKFIGGTAALAVAGPLMLSMEGCDWISTVEQDIPVIVNIVSSIAGVIGQATGNGTLTTVIAAIVNAAVQGLTAGLAAFQDAVNAYKASKSQGTLAAVIAALTTVQGDVEKVVAALPIQVPGVTTIIVAALGTAVTVLTAIQALIPNAAPKALQAGVTNAALQQKVVLPSAASLRVGYNAVLVMHGFGGQQIH